MATQTDTNDLVTSYLRVRTAVGVLAILLPVLLTLSAMTAPVDFVPSISEFFFTPMREALVGTIGAIAVFLISYKGYPRDVKRAQSNWAEKHLTDRRVSWAAAIGALGVAIFPSKTQIVMDLSPEPLAFALVSVKTAGLLHTVSAGIFFAALAAFCLSNFQRAPENKVLNTDDHAENRYYQRCGMVLVLCIIALGLVSLVNGFAPASGLAATLSNLRAIFVIETVGLVAFSLSWLRKGKSRATLHQMWREMTGRA